MRQTVYQMFICPYFVCTKLWVKLGKEWVKFFVFNIFLYNMAKIKKKNKNLINIFLR
jgi:hypothetical protein